MRFSIFTIPTIIGMFFLSLFFVQEGLAQTGTVRGNIFDGDTGEPIISGTVRLSGTDLGTTTDIDGLDVTHTGFVFKDDTRTGFLHASITGEVKVSDDLADYINGNAVQTGIIVARPLAKITQR